MQVALNKSINANVILSDAVKQPQNISRIAWTPDVIAVCSMYELYTRINMCLKERLGHIQIYSPSLMFQVRGRGAEPYITCSLWLIWKPNIYIFNP